ncbi:ABC-2 transporter permease [Sedimentibacter sp. zth1]|uniref:ABC-2 transporter permease n=1 Tax=Sedimentibacter sp. zth1 TaxID=2816908 RepID=UPI001A935B39|nr:ABC-2 transporter permease [Sedimentibacter sp. zth1]QSX04815.1 ABC-2 transporter permease [Sedimentibacter sp. zth1]
MKGLIIKDLINLKKQSKILILILVMNFVISFSNKDLSIFMGVISILFVMLPSTALAYDERSNFDRYGLTMPISRNDLVISKYYLGGIFSIIALVVNLIINIVGYCFMDIAINKDSIIGVVALFSLSVVFLSIVLPFNFKYGVEKGRYIMIVIALIPTFMIVMLSKLFKDTPSYIQNLQSINIDSLLYILPIVALVLLIISMLISIRICNKKEF